MVAAEREPGIQEDAIMIWLRGTSFSDAVGRAAPRPLRRSWSGVSTIESFPHLTLERCARKATHPCTLDPPGLDPIPCS